MISGIVVLSVVIYVAFYLWDRQQIKDERAQLIDLKASELQNKVTIFTLIVLAAIYWANPDVPAWFLLLAINIGSLYSEIFGKIYYRFKF